MHNGWTLSSEETLFRNEAEFSLYYAWKVEQRNQVQNHTTVISRIQEPSFLKTNTNKKYDFYDKNPYLKHLSEV